MNMFGKLVVVMPRYAWAPCSQWDGYATRGRPSEDTDRGEEFTGSKACTPDENIGGDLGTVWSDTPDGVTSCTADPTRRTCFLPSVRYQSLDSSSRLHNIW